MVPYCMIGDMVYLFVESTVVHRDALRLSRFS